MEKRKYGRINHDKLATSLINGSTKLKAGIEAGSKATSETTIITNVTAIEKKEEFKLLIQTKREAHLKELENRRIKLTNELNKRDLTDLQTKDLLQSINQLDNTFIQLSKTEDKDRKIKNEVHIHAIEDTIKRILEG